MAEFGIQYGVLGDHIMDQIHEQGFVVKDPINARRHEAQRQAALTLHLTDLVTDGEYEKILKRLNKRVVDNVLATRPTNGERGE